MMTQVFLAIVETFGMFAIGALVMHLKFIDDKDLNKLSRLIVDIFFPMLAFDSITRNFDPSQLKELWLMPTLGFGLMLFGGILGFGFRYGMRNRTHDRMVTFHHFCAVNNYLFLPLIILSNLCGEKYLALLFIMNIGSTIGFWTLGVGILAGGDARRTFNNIFSINQAAVFLALIFCFCRIPTPVIAGNIFHKLGNCSVPLILLLIGAAIYHSPQIFKDKWDIFYMTAVRLVIIPGIVILILNNLPLPVDVYRVAYIVALMPASASAAVITRRYGGSPEFAGQTIIFTTVVSLLTIPAMLIFMK
jgi:hypothetical protein